MNILAIDIGQNMGWATWSSGKIKSGVADFKNGQFDGAGIRYLKFSRWLADFHNLDLIFYEAVLAHSATYAAHVYGGFIAVLQAHCEQYEIAYAAEGVGTIKKFWTKKGNAGKDVMIKTAREKGFNPVDDNEADALATLHLAVHIYSDSF